MKHYYLKKQAKENKRKHILIKWLGWGVEDEDILYENWTHMPRFCCPTWSLLLSFLFYFKWKPNHHRSHSLSLVSLANQTRTFLCFGWKVFGFLQFSKCIKLLQLIHLSSKFSLLVSNVSLFLLSHLIKYPNFKKLIMDWPKIKLHTNFQILLAIHKVL